MNNMNSKSKYADLIIFPRHRAAAIIRDLESDDELPDCCEDDDDDEYVECTRYGVFSYAGRRNGNIEPEVTESNTNADESQDIDKVPRDEWIPPTKDINEPESSTTSITWLLEHLARKDFQSNYKYLAGCADMEPYSTNASGKGNCEYKEKEIEMGKGHEVDEKDKRDNTTN